jgi:hypothetical protein
MPRCSVYWLWKVSHSDASGLYRCAGDIIYNDQEPVPGHISDVQLKMYSETSNFLQYLKPLTPQNPYFFGQIPCIYMVTNIQ